MSALLPFRVKYHPPLPLAKPQGQPGPQRITIPASVLPNMVLPPACSGSRAPRTCLQKGRDVPSQPPPGTSVGITSLTQRLPTKSHQIAPCTLSRRVQMCPETRRQRLVETEGDKAHFAAAESLLSKKGIQLATTLPETSLPQRTEFCSCRAWSALTYLSSHCRAPLSHLRGHQLLGPSLSSFPPLSVANTCSGNGRTAESGHLRAGSRVPAARLPGGGARGCCPRRRRCRRRGADAVAMVMELRNCPPLGATAARPRPLPGQPR